MIDVIKKKRNFLGLQPQIIESPQKEKAKNKYIIFNILKIILNRLKNYISNKEHQINLV
jgi:hypothetical protein